MLADLTNHGEHAPRLEHGVFILRLALLTSSDQFIAYRYGIGLHKTITYRPETWLI